MTTIRVFPEPDRYYVVALVGEESRTSGKLLAINWLTNRGVTFGPLGYERSGPEVRIRPETLVFEVLGGWEKGNPVYKQRIVRWEAIVFLEETDETGSFLVESEKT